MTDKIKTVVQINDCPLAKAVADIIERPDGWEVDWGDGDPMFAPTGAQALDIVKSHAKKWEAEGFSSLIVVTWHPQTKVGAWTAKALATS